MPTAEVNRSRVKKYYNHCEIQIKTGYEKSRGRSRKISFIITKNGENNSKDFVADMSNSSQMIFSFGAFLLIEETDSRIFESGNGGGKPNSSTQDNSSEGFTHAR